MGRGKVELKRIENTIHRQVSFSKRRSGLMKKAHEISVLCEAEVAVIVFSTKGKLYEYSTHASMDSILERYQRFSYAEKAVPASDNAEPMGSLHADYGRLKAKFESLQKWQRHLMGEQLEIVSLKELQQLEPQLENALKKIRTRKNQLLSDTVSELRIKEKELQEHNRDLLKTIAKNANGQTKQQTHPEQQQGQPQEGSSSSSSQAENAVPPLNIRVLVTDINKGQISLVTWALIRGTDYWWFCEGFTKQMVAVMRKSHHPNLWALSISMGSLHG